MTDLPAGPEQGAEREQGAEPEQRAEPPARHRPRRLARLPELGVDAAARAAGADPEVLRLENLDTDVPPPPAVLEATHDSIGRDVANSYLPFNGSDDLRAAVADRLARQTGIAYDPDDEVVITCGGTEGLFDALLATVQEGDEVIVTDPTYVGMVSRVRMAGATPVFVAFLRRAGAWRLDLDALHAAVSQRTRALFVMNPSMPSGAVLDVAEWEAIAAVCRERGCWLIYNAAMERIVFDGRPVLHPAALPGLAEHVITVGSVSKEWRMIGWRVGWVAGPRAVMADVIRAHLFNVVTPVGLTQAAAAVALRTPDADAAAAVAEWQRRRDVVVAELAAYDPVPAAGGWSLLVDVSGRGLSARDAATRLLQRGRVAATPMDGWGEVNGAQHVRVVFANEPPDRLAGLGARFATALG
jgi:aspartate/methionine/tyrosine aminotransferase